MLQLRNATTYLGIEWKFQYVDAECNILHGCKRATPILHKPANSRANK